MRIQSCTFTRKFLPKAIMKAEYIWEPGIVILLPLIAGWGIKPINGINMDMYREAIVYDNFGRIVKDPYQVLLDDNFSVNVKYAFQEE